MGFAERLEGLVDSLVSGRLRDRLPYIVLLLMVVGYVGMSVATVSWLVNDVTKCWPPENRSRAYISDEIYYVDVARNIAVKVFWDTGLRAPGDELYYTVFFEVFPPRNLLLRVANETGVKIYIMTYKTYEAGMYTVVIVDRNGNPISTTSELRVYTNITSGRVTNAVYIGVESREQLRRFIDAFKDTNWTVVDAIPGWAYADLPGVNYYFNFEHPPLGKYVIAFFMMVLGDNPYVWRLPSIICGVSMLVFAYLVALEVLREVMGGKSRAERELYARWTALLVPAVMLADPVFRNMTVVALLDTYVGAVTLPGVYFFIKAVENREGIKRVFMEKTYRRIWILAGLFKANGLFVFLAEIMERLFYRREELSRKLAWLVKYVLRTGIVYLVALTVVSIPLIGVAGGFGPWFRQAVIGALRWHTEQKTPLTGHVPPWSTPLDWLLGTRPWILWVYHGSIGMVAGISYVYLPSFLLGLALYFATPRYPKYRRLWLSFYGIYAGWVLLYLIGNRTLYSFYIIQFEPLLIALGVSSLALLVTRTQELPVLFRETNTAIKTYIRETIRYERLAVWTAVLVSWLFSFYLHAPWHRGSVYSDIVSIYAGRVLGHQQWYVSPGSVPLPLPYIHFFFEYPPFVGVLWILAEAVASIRTGAESLYIFYTVQALYVLVALLVLADDMAWVRRRLENTPWEKLGVAMFFLMPSAVLYSIYNWDVIAVALALHGLRLYYEGRHRIAGVLFGWSIATKLFTFVFPLMILREERWRAKKMLVWTVLGIASVSWLLLVRSGTLQDITNYLMSWYIEGSWILLLAKSPVDHVVINASRGFMALSILFALLVPLRRGLSVFEKVYVRGTVAVALALFFNYIFTPQMILQVEPLLWVVVPSALFPLLGAMDISTALVILSWFDVHNALDKWALPSVASYIKCFTLLALALWLVYRFTDVRIRLRLEISRENGGEERAGTGKKRR